MFLPHTQKKEKTKRFFEVVCMFSTVVTSMVVAVSWAYPHIPISKLIKIRTSNVPNFCISIMP